MGRGKGAEGAAVSIVTDRKCDGCGDLRPGGDQEWYALIPPGWNGEPVNWHYVIHDLVRADRLT